MISMLTIQRLDEGADISWLRRLASFGFVEFEVAVGMQTIADSRHRGFPCLEWLAEFTGVIPRSMAKLRLVGKLAEAAMVAPHVLSHKIPHQIVSGFGRVHLDVAPPADAASAAGNLAALQAEIGRTAFVVESGIGWDSEELSKSGVTVHLLHPSAPSLSDPPVFGRFTGYEVHEDDIIGELDFLRGSTSGDVWIEIKGGCAFDRSRCLSLLQAALPYID